MDTKEFKEFQEEQIKVITALRETVEKAQKEKKENDSTVLAATEQMNKKLDALEEKNQTLVTKQLEGEKAIAAREDEVKERMNEVEKKLLRMPAGGSDDKQELKAINKAYDTLFRKGPENVSPEELKYLRTDIDPQGGWLVSPDQDAGLLKKITEFSPTRSLVRVTTTSKNLIKVRKRDSIPTAFRVGQGKQDTQSQSGYAMENINIERVTIDIPISIEELNDSDFNMESEMNQDAGEAFAVLEGFELINGTGVGEMEGILVNPDVQIINTGVANALTADSIIEMSGELKDGYTGRYLMNRRTLAKVRTLKDGQGQYLWQNGLQAGLPSTINGDPYVSAIDMPNVVADAFPIAYGDYLRGYRMGENSQTTILRDPFSESRNGLVIFIFHRRNGGKVVLAEAIKKLKISV